MKTPPLILKNCNIVDVKLLKIFAADIRIVDGVIEHIGNIPELGIDMKGKYIIPGLIDSHVHIESGMMTPQNFTKIISACGTTTIIADPHEIANVHGLDGIRYILESTESSCVKVYVMLPSCVPATNATIETNGALLTANELEKLINHPRVLGLGEMMNFSGVINQDKTVWDKIKLAKKYGKIIDGHAPGLTGEQLVKYVEAGIKTDHECSTEDEVFEKIKAGLHIQIRQGSAAKNINLITCINGSNYEQFLFCSDDKHLEDILQNGHMNDNIKQAIRLGVDPVLAIRVATLNAAQCYNLKDVGEIKIGYKADMVVVDNLIDFNVLQTYKDGELVSENGKCIYQTHERNTFDLPNAMNIPDIDCEKLLLRINTTKANVIQLVKNSILTEKIIDDVVVNEGCFVPDEVHSLVGVVERHLGTGNIGLGILKGFNIKNCAIASTISHDSHNLIFAGDNLSDIKRVVEALKQCGGGIAICSGENIFVLSLPIAGLMSNESPENIMKILSQMNRFAHGHGVPKNIEPFMTLGFLTLPVIPVLRLTDKGIYDIVQRKFITP